MNDKLQEIANAINMQSINSSSSYTATIREDGGTLLIKDINSPEAIIVIVITGNQILSITPLFSISSVIPERVAELNKVLLTISLPLSLSSLGIQDDRYILFGSMAINTTIENLVHEIEVQAANYDDVMDSVDEFIIDN
ncbi:MAG: DUF2170 family protein [Piscirickettsiaceae bacterium]|nr:DUF2170 family protein [Piscirickettsiaceae bacterium]